jgi:hypothetical protein
VKCPKSAKPSGCKFKLQVITKKHKGKAETAVAKAKLKGGKSGLISLTQKPAFAAALATASSVLVKETLTENGSKRTLVKTVKLAP